MTGHTRLGVACAKGQRVEWQSSTLPTRPAFFHWRSACGAEVDLILERDGVYHPFEIKLTGVPGKRQTSGLEAFRGAHPHLNIGVGGLICAIERPRWISDSVLAIPWNLH